MIYYIINQTLIIKLTLALLNLYGSRSFFKCSSYLRGCVELCLLPFLVRKLYNFLLSCCYTCSTVLTSCLYLCTNQHSLLLKSAFRIYVFWCCEVMRSTNLTLSLGMNPIHTGVTTHQLFLDEISWWTLNSIQISRINWLWLKCYSLKFAYGIQIKPCAWLQNILFIGN